MEKLYDEKANIGRTPIKIGSRVKVLLIFSPDDTEELSVIVKAKNEDDPDMQVVTVNSPLGACILGKYVEDMTSYAVHSNKVNVKILSVT